MQFVFAVAEASLLAGKDCPYFVLNGCLSQMRYFIRTLEMPVSPDLVKRASTLVDSVGHASLMDFIELFKL